MATLEHEVTRESGTAGGIEVAVRLSREQDVKLEQAASLAGQSRDEFAASVLRDAVDAALAPSSVTVLSERDFDYLLSVLEADVEPNEALMAAAAEYKRRLADGSLQTC